MTRRGWMLDGERLTTEQRRQLDAAERAIKVRRRKTMSKFWAWYEQNEFFVVCGAMLGLALVIYATSSGWFSRIAEWIME